MYRHPVIMSRFLRRCLFFLCVGSTSYDIFPSGWRFFYLALGRLDFLHKLNREFYQFHQSNKSYKTVSCPKDYMVGIASKLYKDPPEVHKNNDYHWCDQSNCCKMDDGFILSYQTIERTSRSKKNVYELSDRHRIFQNINIFALSARNCGPYPSSIEKSILSWHDRLLCTLDPKRLV